MLLIIDNYDSFTYNLVQSFLSAGTEVLVVRNDQITVPGLIDRNPDYLVISPGPCSPSEAGVSKEAIQTFAGQIPILGVCLGHQCIADVFGGQVVPSTNPVHGKTSAVFHDNITLFSGLSNPFPATRYHSLIVNPDSLPECLTVTAKTQDGVIMGIQHKQYCISGVQFHPESILTTEGNLLLRNFLQFNSGSWV